jgi:xylulokinase
MYSIPKAMWIKKNLPEIYNKTKKILLYEDFIVYMLCGVSQIDYSLATRTMGLDINTLTWSDVIFDKAGIDKSLFATPVPSGTVAGKIKQDLGKELGLTDTLIVTGCHDQIAAACGAGVLGVGDAVDGTGTVECITPIFDKIPDNADFYLDNYPVVPHITDGTYATYALSYTGGAAIKWFRDNFAKDISYKDLDAMVKDEPTGILVLPHFAGAASPYRDAYSKAAFVGVTLGTDVGALYRAIMEGVTYEMLVNLEKIKEYGIEPKRLYATGGGASSPVWLQMKADILGLPITPLKAPEVGAVGTVMLVGVAIGAFGSIDEARKILVKEGKTYYPREEKRKNYLEIFSRYKKLYSAVKPLI